MYLLPRENVFILLKGELRLNDMIEYKKKEKGKKR
jgi:hypothetical protein